MSPPLFEGGCLCGAVRYRATGTPWHLTHCHCADCRKASGAPFVSWATFRSADFTFTRGEPAQLSWADRVRSFCGRCGTPITFQTVETPGEIDVTICSLDRPESVAPRDHTWVEDRLPWIKLSDGLPTHAQRRTSLTRTEPPPAFPRP